jgi:hypothetical protein
MDPITLSAAAVAALTPYFSKAVSAAGDKLASAAGEAAVKGVGRLYELLRHKVQGTGAEQPLQDLAQAPADPDNQACLRKALRTLLTDDPAFAEQLKALLPTGAEGVGAIFHNEIEGGVKNLAQGQTVFIQNQS